jgi:hypothetical protein
MVARLGLEWASNRICYNSSATYRLGLATPDVPQQHSAPIGGFFMSTPPFPYPVSRCRYEGCVNSNRTLRAVERCGLAPIGGDSQQGGR